MPCAKCNADDVITGVQIVDRGDGNVRRDLEAVVYKRPDALLFKEAESFALTGRVCAKCGFTELYVREPNDFADAVRESRNAG